MSTPVNDPMPPRQLPIAQDGIDDSIRETAAASKEETGSDTPLDVADKGRTIRGFRWVVICISIYVTCALYGLDTTIAADIQGPIITAFGQVEKLAWGKLTPDVGEFQRQIRARLT